MRPLRERDPGWGALKRGVRAAVVVPVNFAIGSQVIGDAQLATFAAFGSFALLLFVSFPGGRTARLGAYVLLGLAGVALITLGTLAATPDWLAVVAMAVVAFGVLFAGSISSVISAGTQAALLSFILAVMLPGVRSDLPERLAGWGIAVAVSVPVAVFVWPARDLDVLRIKTAALCRALAAMLRLEQPPPESGDSLVAMRAAARELRTAFRSATARSAALTTGARLVVRLVDELEWLATAVTNACADAPDTWPEQGRRLRAAAAQVLAACAETLVHDGDGPTLTACGTLDACIDALERARRGVADEALAELRATTPASEDAVAGEFERPLYAAHELGYAVSLAARTISTIAAADSRSWWAKLTGQRTPGAALGLAAVAQRAASKQLNRRSVWLQNAVRGAIGLTLAVLLARMVDAQNAFWVGLGALSVLRSNALSTGATVVRALIGTVVGFAIGGALVGVLGTSPALLWSLLPLVILVAASAPVVIPFIAGQAAFTVFTIILFNIIAPAGWRIGVVRVEDVALGCLASLVAGFLFWPRGAAAALGAAYAEAYRASSAYLRQAMEQLTGLRSTPPDIGHDAAAAGSRLDDALRQYLAEKGAKHVPLESVTALANGATRLRLAGMAITSLHRDGTTAGDDGLARPIQVLNRRADEVTSWYAALADELAGTTHELPPVGSADGSFLEVVLPAVDRCDDPQRAERAEELLWSGQYLGDVDQVRRDLIAPAGQVSSARARPWWQR